MQAIRTMLVDDNARYRSSLLALLSQWSEVEVIAQADCVDVVMPGMSGIDLTRRLKALSYPPRVLVVTLHTMPVYRAAALEAGADAFLAKDEVMFTLAPAIRQLFPELPPRDGVAAEGIARSSSSEAPR